MLTAIDNFLNKITMYRLTLWCLLALWILGLALSIFGFLPYSPFDMASSLAFIFIACAASNYILAYFFKAPSNIDSTYITAIILALLLSPSKPLLNLDQILLASLLAIASKYIIAVGKKHIFNPSAFGAAAAAIITNKYAIWWMGTLLLSPAVLVIGFLIVRKIKRWDLVLSFLLTPLLLVIAHSFLFRENTALLIRQLVIDSPWMFLAFVMLTEPATTPPRRNLRIAYGSLTGILFTPFFNIVGFYFTPELALLAGNIFSYLESPKQKLILTLKQKVKIANNTYEFIFHPNKKLRFAAGQYMEWTLNHDRQDNRGMRRYFTIASSPTERDIIIGIKFNQKPSSFKKALQSINADGKIVASQLAGDFTLPAGKNKKLVFLAGGIGITPFRSMIKYLIDTKEKRDIVIFYANASFLNIAYKNIFDRAQKELGIKTWYALDSDESVPENFEHLHGPITEKIIAEKVPDYQERIFFISGPKSMIDGFKKALGKLGVHKTNIKTDFFPGFT